MSRRRTRVWKNYIFTVVCCLTALASVVVLGILLTTIALQGIEHLNLDFLTSTPSRRPEQAGLGPAMWGSISICAVCAIVALPLGIGTAIFLEEYKPKNPIVRKLHGFIQLNISNLAGVPSIVYGIIGLTVFVQAFALIGNANDPRIQFGADWHHEFVDESGQYLRIEVSGRNVPMTDIRDGLAALDEQGRPVEIDAVDDEQLRALNERFAQKSAGLSDQERESLRGEMFAGVVREDVYIARVDEKGLFYLQLPFGRSVLAGGLTLMLVVLPIVIIASQEAIRAVPNSLREGALAMGSTKWQMVWRMTLPAAIPGIMTGSILAMSRAIGEAAPILIIAGIVYITFTPQHLMDEFTAMPLQIYDWAGRPQAEFHKVAATGIIVLLAILLAFNATAVFIRQKFSKPLQ